MVGIECLKKISPICISKKIGIYLKNAETNDEEELIIGLIEEDFNKMYKRNKKINKDIYVFFKDDYYSEQFKEDITELSINQLLSLISKNVLIFELVPSKDTIITSDEIFDNYKNDNELSKQLSNTPLINPTNELEIEHKFLYLFNFIESCKSEKKNDLAEIFSDGFTEERLNILSNYIDKTYIKRKECQYPRYEYYNNQNEEYEVKINKLIQFGRMYDNIVEDGSDYLKIDFIIETLISAEKSQYSLLNYISLIEMLIVNSKNSSRSEFKRKLKEFIHDETLDDNEKEYLSGLFYDIRSRMIHGNFDKLKKELLKYKKRYMKNYSFDYGEYKEENWIIGSINIFLKEIVSNIIYDYFHNNEKINKLKKEKFENKKNNILEKILRKLKNFN